LGASIQTVLYHFKGISVLIRHGDRIYRHLFPNGSASAFEEYSLKELARYVRDIK